MPASRRNDWGKTNEGGPLQVQVWQQVDVINVVAIQIMSTSWRDGLS